jgi:hypothetical protein
VSWADANLNEDRNDALAQRIADLEQSVTAQLSELRNEVGLAAAAMRAAAPGGRSPSPIGDLEEQLARAVSTSLSAALESIRESLTHAVASAVAELAFRLETTIASQPAQATRVQWDASDLEGVAASLQHAVLVALSSFERSTLSKSGPDPIDWPATARDVARVNQRLDELRSLLLG